MIEEIVCKKLIDKKYTLATAESCTGGLLSATIINYPGASQTFVEGCVTYSNEAKIKRLNVNKKTLDEHGAVSESTAKEMAIGITKQFNTNIGISTTGIAGPNGGDDKKPVGLVYIGICINGETTVYKNIFTGNRNEIRSNTVQTALENLNNLLGE